MLITDQNELKRFATDRRLWQGIPSIEVTARGRIFLTFYSGGTAEARGNFCVLVKSDDGVRFTEPIAAAFVEGDARCYDPCLWIDPLGRLWFWWAQAPNNAVRAVICDDPDAETLVWGEEFTIGHDVMMNKPTVLSTGEWLFPVAVWHRDLKAGLWEHTTESGERLAFVYLSTDHGKSFVRLGGADVSNRAFDEHMVVELRDGTLEMLVRCKDGIGVARSWDGGLHWVEEKGRRIPNPSSRFHIRRLPSGRLLLINHVDFTGRNNLYALLSDDDGKTWSSKMLLDARALVSYPDVTERDGFIYVTYDRERGCFQKSIAGAYASAREILVAKFTEEDVMAGQPVNPESYLQRVASKLGAYADEASNPYREVGFYSAEDVARTLLKTDSPEEILRKIFECYPMNCMNMHRLDADALDALIARLDGATEVRETLIAQIVSLVRAASDEARPCSPVIDAACRFVNEHLGEEIGVREIADAVGISVYYLSHLFKKETESTLIGYLSARRIARAKEMLSEGEMPIGEIAHICGFGDASYFAKKFSDAVGMTPTEWRKMNT
ncbi:MAG: helix-turn-helix domain-containing protein [Clostridia bacterium]|nr:helix-turn-helix domain-containing protein [Clostridia bacterium]